MFDNNDDTPLLDPHCWLVVANIRMIFGRLDFWSPETI